MIRKASAILMLLVMLLNSAGYYVAWELNRLQLKREMARMIRSGELERDIETLRIFDPENNPFFRRFDKGEFEYRDMLYDVVSESQNGKMLTIKCISDKKEQHLIAGMKGMQEGRKRVNLLQHLVNQALPVSSTANHPPDKTVYNYPMLKTALCRIPSTPFSPPPETI